MKGSMTQRSPGSWTLRFDLGTGPDGKRRQKVVTFTGGKRAAQDELNRILTEIRSGAFVDSSRLTVAQYAEKWLAHASANLSPVSAEDYRRVFSLYVLPYLGSLPLAKLTPLHLQEHYQRLLTRGRQRGTGGLSGTTVAHVHTILHRALEQALRWQLLPRNPADAVDPPRPDTEEACALTPEETAQLLEVARGTSLYLPVLIALGSGLRRGEVMGLRWEDLDLDAGVLRVARAAKRTQEAGTFYAAPKTRKSRRTMTLPSTLVEELVREKGRQAQKKLALGPAYQDHGLVCCQDDGRPRPPGWLTDTFRPLARRAGFPDVTFHSLRHTQASQLGLAGVPPHALRDRMGHSSITITLDLYSHVFPSMERETGAKAEEVLRAAVGE